MSPLEAVLGIIGATAALVAIVASTAVGVRWVLVRLIREEVNPAVNNLTSEIASLKATIAASTVAQQRGAEELHETVEAIRATLADHGARIAVCEEKEDLLWDRIDRLATHTALQPAR